jgi:transposase-like protein
MKNKPNLKRRKHSASTKSTIVQQALEGELSKAAISRQYDINTNMLSRWIREYQSGAQWSRPYKHKTLMLPVVTEVHEAIATEQPQTKIDSFDVTVDMKSGHRVSLNNIDVSTLKTLFEVLP